MKIPVMIRMFFLIVIIAIVMSMLMPAMIFGGTKFLGEVYQVFIEEFNKIRRFENSQSKT